MSYNAGEPTAPVPTTGYQPIDQHSSVTANRSWWDTDAARYHAEHGAFLGDGDLVWGPEGLREADAGLLGNIAGLVVLEVGCGAGQGARWAAGAGAARVVGLDLSAGMLAQGRAIESTWAVGATVASDRPRLRAYVQGDACALPFAAGCFDVAFSAYGAVPFVADSARLMAEVARVLRPGGRWVFSVTHPIRWAFPDAPGQEGLTVGRSYFDRTPYVERDGARATYAEHHRTLGDRVAELTAAGFTLTRLVSPSGPPARRRHGAAGRRCAAGSSPVRRFS